MPGWRDAPYRRVDVWDASVEVRDGAAGSMRVRCPIALGAYPARLSDRLEHWVATTPDATFIARREAGGDWRRVSYAETLDLARRIGGNLLARGLSADRPIVILSDNDIEHQLLALGAMYAGIPTAPISPAYSLISTDFAKLRHIVGLLTPGLVFAGDGARYASAIAAVVPPDTELVVTERPPMNRRATSFSSFTTDAGANDVDVAHGKVGPDTIVRFLFTSGSTGRPKGVINTQRMLCANQAMIAHAFPFLRSEPPLLVDWLPWNHTFGGNHNVGIALTHGGALYIDDGRPAPGRMDETFRNLREIAPTIYFNVPKGFEMLAHQLRRDRALRETFFSRLRLNFFAGASLAQHIWDDLEELAADTIGERIVMMTGLGATETGPSATFCTRDHAGSGSIGLPLPGVELKLVPSGGKLEVRVAGPAITPGYWREPDITAAAYDAEGYYRLGDAIRFADRGMPEKGFVFDGRIAEDFKLATGTWVSVGPLRARAIAALAPYARDVVVAGLDRDFLAAIVIPDVEACRVACPHLPPDAPLAEVLADPALRAEIAGLTDRFAATSTGSAQRIERMTMIADPLSIDAGEVTDKGSVNQRAVLAHRRALVEALYADQPPDYVIRSRAIGHGS